MANSHISMRHTISGGSDFKNPMIINKSEMAELADRSLAIVGRLLAPLKRTGDLEDSWNVIVTSTGFSLWTTDWAAHSIQTGFRQAPPKDVLLDWMDQKSEFRGLDAKESARVAYAIKLAIERGDTPGGHSSIGPLSPSGERRFDYHQQAEKEIRNMIKQRILAI